jgi:hypothetical protein
MEPEFVLGTTYTLSLAFFESVVFPHLNRKHLKRCLLLCDQFGHEMAMTEASALQSAARDYMVATAPSKGTFHPKVWLLLAKDELLLLVGSGNLTQPGFIDNLELFDVVRIAAGADGRELAADAAIFLRGLSELWRGTSDSNLLALQTLREMTNTLGDLESRLTPSADPPVRLLSSFSGSFPAQLARLDAHTAYVAAPYFGNSTAALEELHAALGVRQTFVFPAVHRDAKLDLPLSDASRIPGVKVQSLAVAVAHHKRFAHLKLYGFQSPSGSSWIFTGSVNCTLAAMNGPNVEAGLLRKIAAEELADYFTGADLAAGESGSHFAVQTAKQGWLILWATDVGDQISIELAPSHLHHAPLTQAMVEVRSGQRVASIELDRLFARNGTERIAWRSFGDFRGQLKNAAVIRITATDVHGRPVTGQCLVDDFATLTSDPVHRSAWRAAVALLGAEGMPDYGDVAALFNLAELTTPDGEPEAETEEAPHSSKRVAGSIKETMRDKAALWPPTPLVNEALPSGAYGHGAGNIYWFNRILAAFLSPAHSEEDAAPGTIEVVDAGDEEIANNGSHRKGEAALEATGEIERAARRLWEKAEDAMDRMRERLNQLEVTRVIAPRIWGPATFVFLGVLHVARAIRNKDVLRDHVPSTTSLVRVWLAMLLVERDQGDDYASTGRGAYEGRFFPSLAQDLWNRFGEAPHPEILSIICVAFAHAWSASRFDRRASIPVAQWLALRDVAGDLMAEALRDTSHLEHLWQSYFRDDGEAITWDAVRNAMDELKQATWLDHQGMKDLVILEGVKRTKGIDGSHELSEPLRRRLSMFRSAGFKSEEVSRFIESCGNTRCARYGIETVELQGLRDLRPVICPTCGCLLVPDILNEAFRRLKDGRAS